MIGYRRIAVVLAVAGLSATAGAALWDRHRPAPPKTLVMLSACGLVPAPEPVALPLASLLAEDAPGLAAGLSLGPILHPGLDAPLWVRFEAREIDGDTGDGDPARSPDLRPHMQAARVGGSPEDAAEGPLDGAVLVIPLARDRLPDAIRLGCRHGHVAEVRHRHGDDWHHLPVIPDPRAAPGRPPAADTPEQGAAGTMDDSMEGRLDGRPEGGARATPDDSADRAADLLAQPGPDRGSPAPGASPGGPVTLAGD